MIQQQHRDRLFAVSKESVMEVARKLVIDIHSYLYAYACSLVIAM